MTSFLFHRYEDELNKRSEAENDFMVLKKVSRPGGENKPAQEGDGTRERGKGSIFPGM